MATYLKQLNYFNLLVVISALFIIAKGIIPGWQDKPSDFSNYYISAKLLLKGEHLSDFYDSDWFTEKTKNTGLKHNATFSPFPPITAFVMLPLVHLSELKAKRVWLVLNLGFLLLAVFLLAKFLAINWINSAFIFSLFPFALAANFNLGQVYLVMLCLVLSGLVLAQKNKAVAAVFLWAVAGAVKLFPAVYIQFAPENKKLKWFLMAVGFGIAIWALPLFMYGISIYEGYLAIFSKHADGHLNGSLAYSFTFQSLDALLHNLFVFDQTNNPQPLLKIAELKWMFKALIFGIIGFILFKLQRLKSTNNNYLIAATSIIGIAILFPASANYHFLLLLPAVAIWVVHLQSNQPKYFKPVLLGLIITFNLMPHHIPFVGRHTVNTLIHFPRLYGLIGLFAFFAVYLFKQNRVKE